MVFEVIDRDRRIAEDENGMRLDRWFKENFPDVGYVHLQKLLRAGKIRVDSRRVKGETRLCAGEFVRIPASLHDKEKPALETSRNKIKTFSAATERAFIESITLYEDDALLVLNKPTGLAAQGGSGVKRNLDGILRTAYGDGQTRLAHRLDKDTSGCLIIAKTRLAAVSLAKTFRIRAARKIYWAIVSGLPEVRQGRISNALLKQADGEGGSHVRVVANSVKESVRAVTFYAVIDHALKSVSWISLKPVTGRTHQLRAHMAHIGCPILGDSRYTPPDKLTPRGVQNKLHLLSRRLIVPHPVTGKPLDVTAPLPQHMAQTVAFFGLSRESADDVEIF